jgi:hypothetical protein
MMRHLKSVVKYYTKGFFFTYGLLLILSLPNLNFFTLLEQSIVGAVGFALLIYSLDSLL